MHAHQNELSSRTDKPFQACHQACCQHPQSLSVAAKPLRSIDRSSILEWPGIINWLASRSDCESCLLTFVGCRWLAFTNRLAKNTLMCVRSQVTGNIASLYTKIARRSPHSCCIHMIYISARAKLQLVRDAPRIESKCRPKHRFCGMRVQSLT